MWMTSTLQAMLMTYFTQALGGRGRKRRGGRAGQDWLNRVGEMLGQLDDELARHGGAWLGGGSFGVDRTHWCCVAGRAASRGPAPTASGPLPAARNGRPAVRRAFTREGHSDTLGVKRGDALRSRDRRHDNNDIIEDGPPMRRLAPLAG